MHVNKIILLGVAASCFIYQPAAFALEPNLSTKEEITDAPGQKRRDSSYERAFQETVINTDPYSGETKITGPTVAVKIESPAQYLVYPYYGGKVYGYKYKVRAFGQASSRTIVEAVQVYIRVLVANDWADLNSAYRNGKSLNFTKINKQKVPCKGCVVFEDFGIHMSLSEFQNMISEPHFDFKAKGIGGEVIIKIPQSYIKGFLAAMDEKEAE